MARAITFPEANVVSDSKSGRFGDLPSHDLGDRSVTCWQLSEEERAEVARTGMVWVTTHHITREMFDRHPETNSFQTPLAVAGAKPPMSTQG